MLILKHLVFLNITFYCVDCFIQNSIIFIILNLEVNIQLNKRRNRSTQTKTCDSLFMWHKPVLYTTCSSSFFYKVPFRKKYTYKFYTLIVVSLHGLQTFRIKLPSWVKKRRDALPPSPGNNCTTSRDRLQKGACDGYFGPSRAMTLHRDWMKWRQGFTTSGR